MGLLAATLPKVLALGLALDAGAPDAPAPPMAGASRVVYLNFSDGTENLVQAANDDAATNRSSIGQATPYPAFAWPSVATGATTRAEVIRRVVRRVHEHFLAYNVLITTVRPSQGPYTMVLIGGSARDIGLDLRVGGLAFQDCDDQQRSNLVFAFAEALRGSEHALAVTISQEAAHAFGLEHTANRRDIMHPEIDPQQSSFPDEESIILGDRICNNASQNSHRKLLQTVGKWPGDSKPLDDGTGADRMPPRLSWLAPAETSPLPQPFVVTAAAEDDAGISRVLLSAGDERTILYRPPWTWSLAGFPPGPLTLTLTAYDASGNTAVASRTVELGPPPPGPSGCALAGAGGAPGAAREGSRAGGLVVAIALLVASGARARRRRATRRACAGGASPL